MIALQTSSTAKNRKAAQEQPRSIEVANERDICMALASTLGLFRRAFDGADTTRHDPDVFLAVNRGHYATNYVKWAIQSDEAPGCRCLFSVEVALALQVSLGPHQHTRTDF